MNFFKQQDRARRHTTLLLVYMTIAVVLIVLAINAVFYLAIHSYDASMGRFGWQHADPAKYEELKQFPWWGVISLVTVLVIGIGSLVRYLRLRDGGHAVAEFMGARRVRPDTRDPRERRYLNVVEEMSIASGTPVPDLYVIDKEPGINAFVAGYQPTRAVMVVTRGTLDSLSRDELQGVVAHEFSHIFNGDMRLNVRLIAILAGILGVSIVGRAMIRSGFRTGSNRGGAAPAFLVAGLAVFVIGYMGLFFGRLIKAAVSRQREFLADASSVQYTRNPSGLAGALWKIKQHSNGSLLESEHAEETSHMCFAQSVNFFFQNLLATHPPLDERLARVDRHFHAKRAAGEYKSAAVTPEPEADGAGVALGFAPSGGVSADAGPEAVVASVGNPGLEHVVYAENLQHKIPESVLAAVHDPSKATWVVYGLLLGDTDEERLTVALALINYETKLKQAGPIISLYKDLSRLDRRFRLPLIDLSMPAVRRLSRDEQALFLRICEKVVRIDRRVTLFEFVLLALVRAQLETPAAARGRREYRSIDPVLTEVRILMTLVARAGSSDAEEIQDNFSRAMQMFSRTPIPQAEDPQCAFENLAPVFEKLASLSPLLKQSLLVACADCVMRDNRITVDESEILRGVSELLDCPMPPLVLEDLSERVA